MPMPPIGVTVHYVSYGTPGGEYASQCRAAIVTERDDPNGVDAGLQRVGLAVLNPTGMFFHSLAAGGCRYEHPDNGPDGRACGGTWHYASCQPD
jgi:hypothetical protein